MEPFALGTLYQTFIRTAAKWGDRPAYAVPPMAGRAYHPEGKEYTWTETAAAVEALRTKYGEAGYGYGHRIAILFAQRPEFLFHYYALNGLGCSVVPINPDYRHDEIAYILDHSESCLALAIDGRLGDLRAVARESGDRLAVVSFDDLPDRLPEARTASTRGHRDDPAPQASLGGAEGPAPRTSWRHSDAPDSSASLGRETTPNPVGEEHPNGGSEAALLYTSGTTGRPKGCVLSNEYFHTFGSWYLARGGLLAMREGAERIYNPLPLHHANCLSISAPAMLLTGGCLVFPDRFHASTWWQDLVACRITAVHMQGIIPNVLLKLPPCAEERGHQVRFALCAGIEPSLHEAFETRFGFPVVEMWAMTETGRLLADNVEPRLIHTRAFGRPVPGLEVRIVDERDEDRPVGQPGELVIRHSAAAPRKGFFSGYLKNPEATEEAWRNGWFHTGDVAVRDDRDMLYFVDRKKNIIRRSGENIAAAEVEACLEAHDRVGQVAVFAVPDELREEEVMACVVTKSPADAGEDLARQLMEWCFERLAYFKAPGWYLFVDRLPTGTSQKVQKINLFPTGVDPRRVGGVIDLREVKKPAARATSG